MPHCHAMVAVGRAVGANPYEPETIADRVNTVLQSDDSTVEFVLAVREQTRLLGMAIAQWAPVMLEHDELAEALNDFALMRDQLLEVPRHVLLGRDNPMWREQAVEAFRAFVGEFALFHAQRKLALGKSLKKNSRI
jgi:hypothetical protein